MKWIFFFSILVAGCAESADPSDTAADPMDECALCGDSRADAYGISRDSYLAYGIVDLANNATLTELDVGAGLDVRAARGIVAERPFDFIEQIDTVPWVGRTAFAALATYATAHGFIPACGDGTIQPLLETCDDGNMVNGDGCDSSCSVESAPPQRRLEDIPELIRGSEVGTTLVDPNAWYMRQREFKGRDYPDDIVALMERADGIIANQRANGKAGFDELVILSTSPFYESLFPDEKAALADIWELYSVSSAPIVEVNPAIRRTSHPSTTVNRVGPLVIRPRAISNLGSVEQRLMQRLQQMPRLNLDQDPTTFELADLRIALEDYRQVLTPTEVESLEGLVETIFQTTDELADDGSYVATWPEIPQDWYATGTFASFDGWELEWERWINIRGLADDPSRNATVEGTVEFDLNLLHNGTQSACSGWGCVRAYHHEGVRWVTMDDELDEPFLNYRLMEHWVNGRRVYNRVIFFYGAGPRRNGTRTEDLPRVFPADFQLDDGTALRLQHSGTDDDWQTFELLPSNQAMANLAVATPQTHSTLQALRPGRYEPFMGLTLEVHQSRTAVIYRDGDNTPRPMGLTDGKYRAATGHNAVELDFADPNAMTLRYFVNNRWNEIVIGDGPEELQRDRSFIVEER